MTKSTDILNLKRLIDIGKDKGYITYEELNDDLPEDVASSEESVDDIMMMFEDLDIMVIDEAAQITRHTKGDRRIGQVDTLKSLSNSCGVQLVLLGSYDLYDLVALSAQIARRIQVMHFPRYQQAIEEDVLSFQVCLKMFQKAGYGLWGENLMAEADALMDNTVGCVGTLRSVLVRAEKISEARGGWSKDVLIEALLTVAQRDQILQETMDGESLIVSGVTRVLHHEKEVAVAKGAR